MNGHSSPPERPNLQVPDQDPSTYSYRASGWTEENGYKNDPKNKPNIDISTVSQDNSSARASIITKLLLAACLWVGHHLLLAYVAARSPIAPTDRELDENDTIEINGEIHSVHQYDILNLNPIDLGLSLAWWTRIGTLFAGMIALFLFSASRTGYDQIICSLLKKKSQPLGRLGESLRILTGPLRLYTGLGAVLMMLIGWLLLLLPLAAPYCLTQGNSNVRVAKNVTMEMPSLDFTREAIMNKRIADNIRGYSWMRDQNEVAEEAWRDWMSNEVRENIFYQYNVTANTIYAREHISDNEMRLPWLEWRSENRLRTGLYNGPSSTLKGRLLTSVYSDRIASLDTLPPGSSYNAKFFGPSLVCKDQGGDRNGTAEWQQALKLGEDMRQEFNFDREHPQLHPQILYHAWVPDSPSFRIPDFQTPSTIRPKLDYQSADSARIWVLTYDGDYPSLYDCALHNASYVVKWDYKNWKRADPYHEKLLGQSPQYYSKAYVMSVNALNPITAFNQTIEAELADHTGPNRISHDKTLELEARKSYMAVMEVLGNVLVGSYTDTGEVTDASVKQDARWPHYMTNAMYERIRGATRREQGREIEQIMHKMTASLFGSDTWTIPKNDTVTIYEPVSLLTYDPLILNISYAIPYTLVFIICLIGLRCAKINGGTFSSRFESIILASTNIEQKLTGSKTDRRSVLKNVKVGVEDYLVANDGEWRRGPARKRKLRFVFDAEGLDGARSYEIELTTLKTAPGERAGQVAVTEV